MERDYDREYERQPKGRRLGGTGGAVPVKNDKGEITMEKVKVQRYVAGKRPKYAGEVSDNEDERSEESDLNEDDAHVSSSRQYQPDFEAVRANAADDRRLKRLQDLDGENRERPTRRRHIAEPEILMEESEEEKVKSAIPEEIKQNYESEEEEEVDEVARANRRMELKRKALQRQEELLAIEEEQKGSDSETDESEYEDEEYTDSEDEVAPRLKPVFVKKKDRVTIKEKEIEEEKERQLQLERERTQAESKKQTRKIIEETVAREKISEKLTDENIKCDFETDDENEEDHELWKLRELKRIKRDRDEKENIEKEKQETQRVRNMTEEERLNYLRANPKTVTNQPDKGKYKFLQKYYHRGAFFLDKQEEILARSVAEPTLEDHFDKTILPKVMQVKNFGLAGRTKYTHLLDQDTTRIEDNPWSNQEKFINGKGGGTKQVFDKPTAKKRK